MEDIKVGDFVRLKQGYIGTVENINDFREPSMKYVVDIQKIDLVFVGDDDIVKQSKNLIDLIEEGDYVNGIKIYCLEKAVDYLGRNYIYVNKLYSNAKPILEEDIKTILTKELYEANCYKVEEE